MFMETNMRQSGITVRVQRLGEPEVVLNLPEDSTIAEALTEAGLPTNTTARVDGEIARANDLLDDEDIIVVETKKINQGC